MAVQPPSLLYSTELPCYLPNSSARELPYAPHIFMVLPYDLHLNFSSEIPSCRHGMPTLCRSQAVLLPPAFVGSFPYCGPPLHMPGSFLPTFNPSPKASHTTMVPLLELLPTGNSFPACVALLHHAAFSSAFLPARNFPLLEALYAGTMPSHPKILPAQKSFSLHAE